MSERGRKPGFTMSNEHRDKIKNSNILNALIEHAQGQREMSASQVTAALGLLRKALPDLASVEHSGDVQQTYVVRMPSIISGLDDWDKVAASSLQRDQDKAH